MAAKPTTTNKTDKKAPRGIVPSEKRTRWVKPLAQTVDRLTKRLLGKQGFTHGAIVTNWPDIVGEAMARHSQPEKIVFSRDGVSGGVLHLKIDNGAFATEVQHGEPQIVERINTFFGYRAIERLKLIQGPLPRHKGGPATPPPRPLDAQEVQNLDQTVDLVDDPELKAALERLGKSVLERQKAKT